MWTSLNLNIDYGLLVCKAVWTSDLKIEQNSHPTFFTNLQLTRRYSNQKTNADISAAVAADVRLPHLCL